MDKQEEKAKCCAKCIWFDPRTAFCRCHPPTPVVVGDENGYQRIVGAWPKINVPLADFCSKYSSDTKMLI